MCFKGHYLELHDKMFIGNIMSGIHFKQCGRRDVGKGKDKDWLWSRQC